MVRLLAFHSREEAMDTCQDEFSVKRSTVEKWYKEAQAEIEKRAQGSRSNWLAKTIHQLDACVDDAENTHDRLSAIAQRTRLLGLNAPTRLQITHEVVYQKPDEFAALRDPELRAAALALSVMHERLRVNGQGDGRGDPKRLPHPASIEPGDVSVSRVSVPAALAGPGGGRNGNNVQPGKE